MVTQADLILGYMEDNAEGITSKEAMDRFGCMRLASRIADLRKDGCPIRAERVKVKNRYGADITVARYSLITEENNDK